MPPRTVYDEVIDFLGIPRDGQTAFPRINENKRARVAWLRAFYRKPPAVLRDAIRGLEQVVGNQRITAAKKRMVDLSTVRGQRPPLSPEFRAELVEAFRDEVALLSRLMNRDLSHWV